MFEAFHNDFMPFKLNDFAERRGSLDPPFRPFVQSYSIGLNAERLRVNEGRSIHRPSSRNFFARFRHWRGGRYLKLIHNQRTFADISLKLLVQITESGVHVRIMTATVSKTARKTIAARPPQQRSKVTNRSALFIGGSEESAWSRRFRDLKELHEDDLGGVELLSEAQMSLCRCAAALEVELEKLTAAMSRDEEVDLDKYGRNVGQLRRVLETLGLQRQARDITPTLDAYLKDREAA